MFNKMGKRSRYFSACMVVLAIALLIQAGRQASVQQTQVASPANANQASVNTPRISAPQGISANSSNAQSAPQAPFEVGTSVMNDVSPALRDIKPIPAPAWTTIREMPERDVLSTKESPNVKDPVVQSNFGSNPLNIPATIQNFNGVNNRDGVYPPDTNGDVGPNHFVQWVNLSFQVFSKTGASLYGPAEGNTLWSGFGGAARSQNAGDPIVLYDPMADRWLMSQFTASNPYGECVAISTSPDPTGTWYRYFFQFSTTVFYDYPHLGVWPDGYYMSANRFNGNTSSGPAAIVFNRSKMLLGQAATFQAFNLSSTYGTLLPSDLDGSTLPPSGSPNYFLSKGNSVLYLWKFHTDWVTPANSTLTGPTSLSTAAFSNLCTTTRNCVAQPSTTVKLDGLGDRLMHRVEYRNFGDHESLVANHTVSLSGQAAVRWYEIRNPNSAPSIYQQGTYSPDSTNRWLGSVAMDHSGNMALGYSVSSSSVFPGIRYTGRLVTDPLGQMSQGEGTIINGSGSQTGTGSRWGDYAMMTVDPTDDCTFWFTTEYIPSTGTAPWNTRIASFKFPSCGGSVPTNTPTTPPAPTNTPTRTPTSPPGTTNTPTRTSTPVPPTATRTNTPVQPTATPTPSGGCGETLTNGGFEGGQSPWVETSTGGYQLVDGTRPHTGTKSAYLADYNNGTDTIYQQVTIPSNATSATLTYWWNVRTNEACCTPYDYMYAQVLNSSGTVLATLQTLNNASTQNTWTQSSFNLLAYKGKRFASTSRERTT